jgi:predicted DNA-binding transcriptional regulator YafY
MKEAERAYYKTCSSIEINFAEESIPLIKEYFPDCNIEQLTVNKYRLFINVPQNERLWKALLLSFGDKVTVVSPAEYKQELIETAQKFLSNYDI